MTRARTTEGAASATQPLPSNTWKLDTGPSQSAMSNYFPARNLTKSSTRSGAQWETRIIPTSQTPAAQTEGTMSQLTFQQVHTPRVPKAPIQTPRDQKSSDQNVLCLNGQYVLKITSADGHENVSSINLNGKHFDMVDTADFERFKSCAFIQASRTSATVNLDTFDKLENLTDLEINMAGLTLLNQPALHNSWALAILDLSYNSLAENINRNIQILASLPKLRVLNLSGNDLIHFGTVPEGVKFPSLQLLIAEDNNLTSKVFLQLASSVQIPNLKVLLLDFNKIKDIPDLAKASSVDEGAYSLDPENGLTGSLTILSLAGNPIRYFENFSNVLQFSDLEVLKLQDTPFVKKTSKNPKVVDESGILVERHYRKKDVKKLHHMGAKIKARKVQEPERHKRDKTWFYELIENLEKRVKYEVRSAILGGNEEHSGDSAKAETKRELVDEPRQGDPVFLTELEAELDAELASTIDASEERIHDETDNHSIVSDTITDMSILNGSEITSTRSLETPPLPISESVKRLKMAFSKQTMFHQNHGLTKFPYHGKQKSSHGQHTKPDPLAERGISSITLALMAPKQGILATEHKVLGRSLQEMQDLEAKNESVLLMKNRSDTELYTDIKDEYEKLRVEINNMSVDSSVLANLPEE